MSVTNGQHLKKVCRSTGLFSVLQNSREDRTAERVQRCGRSRWGPRRALIDTERVHLVHQTFAAMPGTPPVAVTRRRTHSEHSQAPSRAAQSRRVRLAIGRLPASDGSEAELFKEL